MSPRWSRIVVTRPSFGRLAPIAVLAGCPPAQAGRWQPRTFRLRDESRYI